MRLSAQYKPFSATDKSEKTLYFVILPEIKATAGAGRNLAGSMYTDLLTRQVSNSSDSESFAYPNGIHWIDKKPVVCSSCYFPSDRDRCPICEVLDNLKYSNRVLYNTFRSFKRFAVNVYFVKNDANPPELAGKVFWMNLAESAFRSLFSNGVNYKGLVKFVVKIKGERFPDYTQSELIVNPTLWESVAGKPTILSRRYKLSECVAKLNNFNKSQAEKCARDLLRRVTAETSSVNLTDTDPIEQQMASLFGNKGNDPSKNKNYKSDTIKNVGLGNRKIDI